MSYISQKCIEIYILDLSIISLQVKFSKVIKIWIATPALVIPIFLLHNFIILENSSNISYNYIIYNNYLNEKGPKKF